MTTKTKTLTDKQKKILRSAWESGSTHSGRGGWSGAEMRALEARGMVVKGKTHVWEQDWKLTDAGREAGRQAHEAFVQSFRDADERAARARQERGQS